MFATLLDAVDYAATGQSGMNFFDGRGNLDHVLSYSALQSEARQTGARLLGRGLVPGQRVGLVAETEGDFVRAFVGCMFAGLVPCPMPLPSAFGHRGSYSDQIRRIAKVAEISAVLCAPDYLDWIIEALAAKDLDLRFVGSVAELDTTAEAALPDAPDPDALAYLQFSSGTTKAPKGIAISHRALMANIEGMARHKLGIGSEDRGVNWLPFYHDMGLVGCVLLPIGAQMSIDYLATGNFIRRPGVWLKMISERRATLSYAPSFGYDLASRRPGDVDTLDLSSWRIAGIGGDMVKTANLARFSETFAPIGFRASSFLASYGMAELSLGLTFAETGGGCRSRRLGLDQLDIGEGVETDLGRGRRFAICGSPLPKHEIELRSETGEPVPDGRVGTIFARGPSVMQGYFNDPVATAEALHADGWLNTGDLGVIIDGELIVTGRAKDLIIINGRNIWPQDIEWTIEHHISAARESGVVAFGQDAGEDDEEEIAVVIECRLPEEARPELISDTDALVRRTHGIAPRVILSKPGLLPRTTSGKLSRAKARAMYLSGSFA